MKSTMTRVRLIGILTVMLCQSVYAEEGRRDDQFEEVRTTIMAAVGAPAQEYRLIRDRFLTRGEAVKPLLKRAARDGVNWQERLMASIFLERLENRTQIQDVLRCWRAVEVPRGKAARLDGLAEWLAKYCNQIPMFLVESVWKSNELSDDKGRSSEVPGFACWALAKLTEKRAIEPTIAMLRSDWGPEMPDVRMMAAVTALSSFKDPRAVPVLCETYILNSDDTIGSASARALAACIERGSIEIVEAYARRLCDGPAKSRLLEIAKQARDELEK